MLKKFRLLLTSLCCASSLLFGLIACVPQKKYRQDSKPTSQASAVADGKQDAQEKTTVEDEPKELNFLPPQFLPPTCEKIQNDGPCYVVADVLNEVSGLVASRTQENVFWTHNDGGTPSVYGINKRGEILVRVDLQGAEHLDYEDIAIHSTPQGEFIYQGDIGDKDKEAGSIFLYKFLEPTVNPVARDQITTVTPTKFTLSYDPNLGVLDFESMMIDPRNGDLYLFQKGARRVFKGTGDLLMNNTVQVPLILVTEQGGWSEVPSGADFSKTGLEFIIRDERQAWIYSVKKDDDVANVLKGTPTVIPMANEFNGEAITYGGKGIDLYTASENQSGDLDPVPPQPVWYYQRVLTP